MWYKTYQQYQAYAEEVFPHEPECIKGLMAVEFICDITNCDRKSLEFALKGDTRYKDRFFEHLQKALYENPDKENFLALLHEELEIDIESTTESENII
ncbi:MAG: hypothetical protein IKI37_03180 [Oscillospiraceae bacterium]|nr:hypothetical protein [Oscillospiraceae bacterium]